MREIKFRIWNGESIEETIIDFNLDKEIKHKEFYIYPGDVFMQYTGLKDKNGVEIYEGDILKCFGDIAEVYYDNKCALFRYRYYSDGDTYMEILGTHSYEHFEVIGNIYEDKELLNIKD